MLPVVSIEGRVASDPELKFAASGTAVGRVRLVASSRKKEGDQWVDDKTLWINVTCFKSLAENVAGSLKKGDLVIANGRIQTEEWETDGQKRSAIVMIADSIGPSLVFKSAEIKDTVSSGGGGGSAPAAQTDEPPF